MMTQCPGCLTTRVVAAGSVGEEVKCDYCEKDFVVKALPSPVPFEGIGVCSLVGIILLVASLFTIGRLGFVGIFAGVFACAVLCACSAMLRHLRRIEGCLERLGEGK